MRFSPPVRKLVLTTHVATSVGWLGADAVLVTLGVAGLNGVDEVYPAAAVVGVTIVPAVAVLALVTGVLCGLGTKWGLVRYGWVAIKLVITVVTTGLVLFLLGPNLVDLGARAPDLTTADRFGLVVPPTVSGILLIVSTVLSTWKRPGRIRARRPGSVARKPGSVARKTGSVARKTATPERAAAAR